MARRLVVYGIPSAAGAFTDAPTKSPAALRGAGLIEALRARGLAVTDAGDAPVLPAREDPEHPKCRNVAGVLRAMRAAATAGEARGGLTLVLGGDCSLLPGLLRGARRRVGGRLGLVMLDAHGDLNTPETSPSGRICGMALAVALGLGDEALVAAAGSPPLEAGRTVMLGFRELDPGERRLLEGMALAQEAAAVLRNGPDASAESALSAIEPTPFVVHLDVDVIDAEEPANPVPPGPGRGLTRGCATRLLQRLLQSPHAVAVAVAGYDAGSDPGGSQARVLVEMLGEAFTPGPAASSPAAGAR